MSRLLASERHDVVDVNAEAGHRAYELGVTEGEQPRHRELGAKASLPSGDAGMRCSVTVAQLEPQHPRSRGEDRRSIMGPDRVGKILDFRASSDISENRALPAHSPGSTEANMASTDLLAEVDHIFEMRSRRMHHSADRLAQADTENTRLQDEFASVRAQTIEPAMQGFLERLRMNGGGGLLEIREGVQGAGVSPRVRLWMSLSGELIGRPRQDQHPYLQLDFDMAQQRVNVAEGDMWKGHGTSGPAETWIASEITVDMVTQSLLGILRRAAL